MPSHEDNVYFKRGKKYVPFGLRYDQNYLPDGIWYVRHYDHSFGHTNINHYLSGLYKVGEAPKCIDIPKLCSMHTYTEYVMASPEFREIMDKGYYSFQEITAKIVALVIKLNETLKDKEKDGTRQRNHSKVSK